MRAGKQHLQPFRRQMLRGFFEAGQWHHNVLRFWPRRLLRQLLPLYEDIQRSSDVEGQRVRLRAEEGDALRRWG